jgi:uncharacterized membrane protein
MKPFPSIPAWDGLHPAMVHFPIALLFAAPLLLLVSLFMRRSWRPWAIASLTLMTIGTIGAWFAAGTGHAAAQLIEKTSVLERAIGQHEALGVTTRNWFTLVTVLFGAVLLVEKMLKRPLTTPWRTVAHSFILVACVGCAMMLANAANLGGRLVHQSGLRAMVGPAATSASTLQAPPGPEDGKGQLK